MCDVRCASSSTQEKLNLRQRFYRFLETGEQRYIPTRTAASCGESAQDMKILEVGMQVRVVALQSRSELNGCEGSIVEFDNARDRWNVVLTDGSGLSLKSEHLEQLSHVPCLTSSPLASFPDTFFASCTDDVHITPTLQAGMQVQVAGLASRPELNGRVGSILEFDDTTGRWNVVMTDGSGLSLRPGNLQLLEHVPCSSSSPSAQAGDRPSASCKANRQNIQTLEAGMQVRVAGLASRPELNGCEGSLRELNDATGRWNVVMADGSGLSLRPHNLEKLESVACAPSTSPQAHAANVTARCCGEAEEADMLEAGMHVRVAGLTSRRELNGREGRVLGFDATGRWKVAMQDGSELSFKSRNLEQSTSVKSSSSSPASKNAVGAPGGSGRQHSKGTKILEAGTQVRVTGLKNRPELNGLDGSLLGLDAATGRCNVAMRDGSGLSVKSENLKKVEHVPSLPSKHSPRGSANMPAVPCTGIREETDLCDAVTRCPPSSPSSDLVIADKILHDAVALEVGMRVRVIGHPEINGYEGSLLGHDSTTGQWKVAMDGGVGRSLCPRNLRCVGHWPVHESALVEASAHSGQSASAFAAAAGQSAAELEPGMRVSLSAPRHRPDVGGREASLLKLNAAQNSWDVVLDDGSCLKSQAGNLEWVGNIAAAPPSKIPCEAKPNSFDAASNSRASSEIRECNLLVASPKESSSEDATEGRHTAVVSYFQGALYPGAEVEITGVRTKPQINGCRAFLVRRDETCRRWEVSFEDGSYKMLRSENLKILQTQSHSAYRAAGGSIPAAPKIEWELTD